MMATVSESEEEDETTTTMRKTAVEVTAQLKRGSLRMNSGKSFARQSSLDPRRNALRFSFGRQSSMDPIRRNQMDEPDLEDELTLPENLDSTMQLLFMACRGDAEGVEDLLNDGVDVNSIDLDARTALHVAACEGCSRCMVTFIRTQGKLPWLLPIQKKFQNMKLTR